MQEQEFLDHYRVHFCCKADGGFIPQDRAGLETGARKNHRENTLVFRRLGLVICRLGFSFLNV